MFASYTFDVASGILGAMDGSCLGYRVVCLPPLGEGGVPTPERGLPCEGAVVSHRQVRPLTRPAGYGAVRHGLAVVAGRVGEYNSGVHGPLPPPRIKVPAAMAWALDGSDAAHAPWHAWRCGGAASLQWMGLPVQFLVWWGRWHHQATATYYGDAPESFVVAEEARLPWLPGEGGAS